MKFQLDWRLSQLLNGPPLFKCRFELFTQGQAAGARPAPAGPRRQNHSAQRRAGCGEAPGGCRQCQKDPPCLQLCWGNSHLQGKSDWARLSRPRHSQEVLGRKQRVKESLMGDTPLNWKGPFHGGLHTGFSQPQLKQTATAQSTTQRCQLVVRRQPAPESGNAQSCYSGKSITCFPREKSRCPAAH